MVDLRVDELTVPPTRREFEASMYRVMSAVGMRTSSWKPGAVVRAIVTGVCVIFYAFAVTICQINRSGFLELSSGYWRRLCAKFVFGVDYIEAGFASGLVRVDNTLSTMFDEEPGDVVFLGADGQEYRNLDRMQVNALQTGVYINVIATVAGQAGTAPAGTITRFGAVYPGLTVTNPTALTGWDDESDASLYQRSKDSTAALSPNGPKDAYRYLARNAKRVDGTSLGVNRVRVVPGLGDYTLTVYAANASGALPGSVADPSTDLGRLHYLLNTEVAPIGDIPTAASAAPVVINAVGEIWIYTDAGMTDAQAGYAMLQAFTAYVNAMDIGGDRPTPAAGYVYLSTLRAEIRAAIPQGKAFHCVLSSPAADVAIGAEQVPVAGTLTMTIHWVTR